MSCGSTIASNLITESDYEHSLHYRARRIDRSSLHGRFFRLSNFELVDQAMQIASGHTQGASAFRLSPAVLLERAEDKTLLESPKLSFVRGRGSLRRETGEHNRLGLSAAKSYWETRKF